MRYLFVFLTLVIGVNSMAQSKKEQIAILTNRLDSLNKEYIKDTTYLSNTVETIDREYTILSMQYEEAQELIKKKSATISEKTNTIKSLNTKNMELMEELKKIRLSINAMEIENKRIKKSLDSLKSINSSEFFFVTIMNNKQESPATNVSFLADYEIKLYCGDAIITVFNDSGEGWLPEEKDAFYLNTGAGGERTYSFEIISEKEVTVKREFMISGNLVENWEKIYRLDANQWNLKSELFECWDFNGNLIKCDKK